MKAAIEALRKDYVNNWPEKRNHLETLFENLKRNPKDKTIIGEFRMSFHRLAGWAAPTDCPMSRSPPAKRNFSSSRFLMVMRLYLMKRSRKYKITSNLSIQYSPRPQRKLTHSRSQEFNKPFKRRPYNLFRFPPPERLLLHQAGIFSISLASSTVAISRFRSPAIRAILTTCSPLSPKTPGAR